MEETVGLPRDDWNQPAEDGNAAHWVADNVIKGGGLIPSEAYLGETAPNGVLVTQEMIDAVDVYVADVRSICDGKPFKPHTELRIEMNSIVPGENWGTTDCAAADGDTRTAYIWDFKYGWDIVEAFENWQMLNYGVGLTPYINKVLGSPVPKWFEFRIVQPRPHHPDGPVRVWRISFDEAVAYGNRIRAAAAEAVGPNPTVQAAPHCKHCSARHACPSLESVAIHAHFLSEGAVPVELTPEQLGKQLTELKSAEKMLKMRISGLEEQAKQLCTRGTLVPGWELRDEPGRQEWTKSEAEVLALGGLAHVDLAKQSVLTPTQAIAAGVPKDLVALYSGRSARGLKLVPMDNKRAERVFGKTGE